MEKLKLDFPQYVDPRGFLESFIKFYHLALAQGEKEPDLVRIWKDIGGMAESVPWPEKNSLPAAESCEPKTQRVDEE